METLKRETATRVVSEDSDVDSDLDRKPNLTGFPCFASESLVQQTNLLRARSKLSTADDVICDLLNEITLLGDGSGSRASAEPD